VTTLKHIESSPSFERKMKMLANPVKPMKRGMEKYLGFLEPKITPYPSATAANKSPGINGYSWYQRGLGTKTVTGKVYPTSQQMSKKWSFRTRILANVVRGYIKNEASYSDYVQGEAQVWYHANRGWRRVDKVIDASLQVGARYIGKEMDKELSK